MPVIKKAVEDFTADFETVFGKGVSIVDLHDISKASMYFYMLAYYNNKLFNTDAFIN